MSECTLEKMFVNHEFKIINSNVVKHYTNKYLIEMLTVPKSLSLEYCSILSIISTISKYSIQG